MAWAFKWEGSSMVHTQATTFGHLWCEDQQMKHLDEQLESGKRNAKNLVSRPELSSQLSSNREYHTKQKIQKIRNFLEQFP